MRVRLPGYSAHLTIKKTLLVLVIITFCHFCCTCEGTYYDKKIGLSQVVTIYLYSFSGIKSATMC